MSDEELVEALRRTFAADAAGVVAEPDVVDVVVRRRRRERRRLITLGVVVMLALVGTGVLVSQFQRTPSRVVDVPSGPGPSRSSDVVGPQRLQRSIADNSSFSVEVGDPSPQRVGIGCVSAWVLDLDTVVASEEIGQLRLVLPLARSDEFAVASIAAGAAPGAALAGETNRAILIAVSAPSGRSVTAEFIDGTVVTVDVQRELAVLGRAQEQPVATGAPDPLLLARLTVTTRDGADVDLAGWDPLPGGAFGADGQLTGRAPSESAVECGG